MRSSTLRLAWRNLGRNRKRTGLALAAIGLGQFALLAMSGITRGYTDAMLETVTGPMVGHVQIHAPGWRDEQSLELSVTALAARLDALRENPGVARASARIYAPALVAVTRDAQAAIVLGIDPEAESGPKGLLATAPEGARPGEYRVLVGRALAQSLGVTPGSELAVVGQGKDGSIANDLYTVAGVLPSAIDLVNRQGVLMSLEDAQQLFVMPDEASEIILHAARPEAARELAGGVAARPAFAGLEVLPWQDVVPELVAILELADVSSYIVLIFVFVAAAAGVANTMMMATFERLHEFGMLLALGATPARIMRLIVAEAALLGLLGVALGTLLGAGFVAATRGSGLNLAALGGEAAAEATWQGMAIPIHIFPRLAATDVLVGVAAVAVTSLLAALWPAWHAARLEPMEAMRS